MALAHGEPDVDGMLAGMPSPLLTEWLAYDRISPIPDLNSLCASLMAIVCNSAGRIYSKPVSPSDFLPDAPEAPKPRQTEAEQIAIMAKFGCFPRPIQKS